MTRPPLPVFFLIGILACSAATNLTGRRALAQADRRASGGEDLDPNEVVPPPNENCEELSVDRQLRKERGKIGAILMAGKFADDQQDFDTYYNNYALARWSVWKELSQLSTAQGANFRTELRNELRRARSGEVHDHLNGLVLKFMQKLLAGNYYRAAKVNAMLMIGELNSVEPTATQKAVPLPDALKPLLAAVEDSDTLDAVRAAAMVGIQRRAAIGVQDEEEKRLITAAMLQVVAAGVPSGAAAAGRDWICGQALDVLGWFGSAGEGNVVFNAMVGAVADAKLSFRTREIAAESLGRLGYANAAGIDPVEAAVALGQFAADACEEELRLLLSSNGIEIRRLKPRLDAVLAALGGASGEDHKGILPLAKEGQQAFLRELQESLQKTSDLLDPKGDVKKMQEAVEAFPKTVKAWQKKKPG